MPTTGIFVWQSESVSDGVPVRRGTEEQTSAGEATGELFAAQCADDGVAQTGISGRVEGCVCGEVGLGVFVERRRRCCGG